jgi:hypothetical protein
MPRRQPLAVQQRPVRAPEILDLDGVVDAKDRVVARHRLRIDEDVRLGRAADADAPLRRQLVAGHPALAGERRVRRRQLLERRVRLGVLAVVVQVDRSRRVVERRHQRSVRVVVETLGLAGHEAARTPAVDQVEVRPVNAVAHQVRGERDVTGRERRALIEPERLRGREQGRHLGVARGARGANALGHLRDVLAVERAVGVHVEERRVVAGLVVGADHLEIARVDDAVAVEVAGLHDRLGDAALVHVLELLVADRVGLADDAAGRHQRCQCGYCKLPELHIDSSHWG